MNTLDKINKIKITFKQESILSTDQLISILAEAKKLIIAEKEVAFKRLQTELKFYSKSDQNIEIDCKKFMTLAEESMPSLKDNISAFKQ